MTTDKAKKISPNKKFYAETNGSLLHIGSSESRTHIHTLALNQYELRKPSIFRWSQDSKAIGMLIARSLPDDAGGPGYLGHYWVCLWYPFQQSFYTVHFPCREELEADGNPVDSILVLADQRTVICSVKGKELKTVLMPEEKMLSNWQKEKQVLASAPTELPRTDKKEWTWNHDQYGYEGVNLYGGEVLWFQHTHNPHAGGAALSQSFEDFLANGPAGATPGQFFKELYSAVQFLASQKNK